MKCPMCGLLNPDIALRCDCGWDFPSSSMKESYVARAGSDAIEAGKEHRAFGWYLEVLRKYAVIEGRAQRREFWMWTLFNAIFLFASILLAQAIASPGQSDSAAILPSLYLLAVFTPGLCVTVRRLHDVNRSGWWLLIGFVPLFGVIVLLAFEVTEGTPGPNRFGPDPQRSVSPDASSTAATI